MSISKAKCAVFYVFAVYGEPYNGSDSITMDDNFEDMYGSEYQNAEITPGQGSKNRNQSSVAATQRNAAVLHPQHGSFQNSNHHGRRNKSQNVSFLYVFTTITIYYYVCLCVVYFRACPNILLLLVPMTV